MKKVGIIGGAGPLASSLFYETVVKESLRISKRIPEILLINFPFTRGLTLEERERNGYILHMELNYCLHILKNGGAELGVIVCNTLHLDLPRLQKEMFFLSLPELVLKAAKDKKHFRLLLLATQNTCRAELYNTEGFELLFPSEEDQKKIDRIIDHVLEGHIYKKDSAFIAEVIRKYDKRVDGVVLGCTDLPVLHHHFPIPSPITLYDSVKIPAKLLIGYL